MDPGRAQPSPRTSTPPKTATAGDVWNVLHDADRQHDHRGPPQRAADDGGSHVVDDGRCVYVTRVVVCRPHDATTTPIPVPARGSSRAHGRSA